MKSKLKIIHIEDNPYDAVLIHDLIVGAGIGCDIDVIESRDTFIKILNEKDIDLVLSDFTMYSFNGMEALEIAKGIRPEIPFIFISGTIGEELAVESLLLGARDYVLKNKLSRLIPAINRVMNEIVQEREKKTIAKRLDLIVKATNDLIWEWDIENHEFFWNETTQNLSGLDFNNSLSDREWWKTKVHPDDHERVRLSIMRAISDGSEFWNCAYKILKDNSNYSHVIDKAYIIRERGGKAVRMIGAMTDITKEKTAEETIQWQKHFYEKLLDEANVWMALIDKNGVVVLWNQRAEYLSGYTKDAFIGNADVWSNLFGDRGDKVRDIASKAAIMNRKVKNFELMCTTSTGEKLIMSWSSNHVRERNGEVWGTTFIGEDISKRKKVEHEIIQAKEKAEEMNKLKTNFLANMSHELRTPMVGINGFSQLLIRELEDPDLKEMAQSIYSSGMRLTKTLNLILDLSKIEAEQHQIQLKETHMNELVLEASNIFWGAAEFKKIEFEIIEHDKNIIAILDATLFNNVIENLLNNAFKFTESGKVKVELGHTIVNNKKMASVKIHDTGIGIPQEMLETVFLEFRQVSEGTGRNFEGSGLGLTVTKKFVEKMNGTISVESIVGEGSVFSLCFQIPETITDQHIQNVDSTTNIAQESIPALEEKKMPKILIVEDDPTNFFLAKMILGKIVQLEHVTRGADAIEKANNAQFDGILMDINLGRGLTGIETVGEIRKISGYEQIPIAALTAYAFKEDKIDFLAMGCDYYLSKPYIPQHLIDLVKKMCGI